MKSFCYRCIHKLPGKETSSVIRDFLSVQSEMLAMLQSLKTVIASREGPNTSGRKAPSSREGIFSQGGTFASSPRTRQRPPPSLMFGVEEFEEPGESDQSTLLEGENSESESQDSEGSRHNRHLFPVEDMEGLLRAIYASEDILQLRRQPGIRCTGDWGNLRQKTFQSTRPSKRLF